MHPLDAWLGQQGKNREWLAGKLDISEATISRLVSGKQWPSRELAAHIRRLTKGAVTPNDFLQLEKGAA